jgi:hypothetical protein
LRTRSSAAKHVALNFEIGGFTKAIRTMAKDHAQRRELAKGPRPSSSGTSPPLLGATLGGADGLSQAPMSLPTFRKQRSATNVPRFSEGIAKGPQPSSARTGRRGRCTGRRRGSERH